MRRFTLKTWNCFGAAQTAAAFLFSKEPPDPHRFRVPELKRIVEGVDVVCMQELFVPSAESFFDALNHDHKLRDHNTSTWWPLTFGGSGLGIASRFPIVEQAIIPFSRPHVSSERFARKGVLHARLRVPGELPVEVDIITTHMQSGYDAKARAVRARQLGELGALAERVASSDRPVVVCGDMNIDGLSDARRDSEYRGLVDALPGFVDVGAEADQATFHPHPDVNPLAHRFEANGIRQRIDYVFFRGPDSAAMRVLGSTLRLQTALETSTAGVTFASDHFALEVTFEVGDSQGAPVMQTPT
jgi:endonuclease/exonuclease/phosphatase family metal-dependent hydrolase